MRSAALLRSVFRCWVRSWLNLQAFISLAKQWPWPGSELWALLTWFHPDFACVSYPTRTHMYIPCMWTSCFLWWGSVVPLQFWNGLPDARVTHLLEQSSANPSEFCPSSTFGLTSPVTAYGTVITSYNVSYNPMVDWLFPQLVVVFCVPQAHSLSFSIPSQYSFRAWDLGLTWEPFFLNLEQKW